ncbi:uncharacterized protein LOC112575574 isoform X2 [Pomacea canaliculata]|uniref:uncharacterized protein LOC112575574 isoform X2 n=1 Tax=Pomacea canaliculata TaxID=400727 RepID=UPI000D736544|nr:uncharacterized protein LOC112575574 isoform X2 [Pomacea canaliculata]
MAQLEQVKTTIYNLGLHDPRELRATKGRTLAAAPHNTFRDLCTEPPLSSISYQHTAWGSNSSIPEMIKKFGETGAGLGRPSSAKATSVNHPPRKLKIRPQSAKDPLCPNGKKTLPIVKGNHFEPGERLAKDILPHAFISGWADAPAGFHLDFSQDQADEKLDATGDAHNKHSSQSSFLPSTPASSPRQLDDYSPSPSEKDEEKKTSSFGISLSLYMPSAEDNENTDEPDTGRLLKKADSFVEDHRKRSAAKIKLFTANADITPGKTSEKHVEKTFVQTGTGTNFVPPEITDNRVSFEKVQDVLVFEDSKTNTNEVDSHLHTVIREQEERAWDDQTALDNSKTCILTEEMLINDFETEKNLATGDYETLPTKDGHELEYLGPQKNDRKPKIHPIFLESEGISKAHMDQEKSAQLDKNTATGSRTVVQICEEKNVMVDITPRNLGRKLPDKSLYRKILQRKHQGGDGQTAENMSDKSSHLSGQRSESEPTLEIMATRVKNNRMMDARLGNPAPTITVVYDDGDNDESRRISNIRSSDKVKKQRQKGVKEKDIVTMVSEVGPDSVEDIKKDSLWQW